jgi:membrane protein
VSGSTAVARSLREEIKKDSLSLVAAGVAFYGLLAIFPAIIALVTVYGLVADPDRIAQQLKPITKVLPDQAADLLTAQLTATAQIGAGGLTLGLVISLGATVWASAGAVRALIAGLNVIFGLVESRGFLRRAVLAVALTLGAMLTVTVVLALVAAFPVVLDRIGLDPAAVAAAQALRWVLLVVVVGLGLAVLYRFGPDPAGRPRWRWVSWGTVAALAVWILGSLGFSFYVSNFGSYNKTYGSLAAVIVLMLWLYLGAFAVLLGAEIDSVRE